MQPVAPFQADLLTRARKISTGPILNTKLFTRHSALDLPPFKGYRPCVPAPLDVNWEAVRTLAVAVGVREAARQCGIPEDAALMRSMREGWLKNLARSEPLPSSIAPTPVIGVIKPHEVLSKYNNETRLHHAVGAHKISEKIAGMDADELFLTVPNVLAAAKHAAVVHGWQNSQVNVGIRLDQIAQSAAVSVELPPDEEDSGT